MSVRLTNMTIDLSQYAQILVCPVCHSKFVVDGHSFVCQSPDCRLRFTVKDDIPVMLADDARLLSPEEWSAVMSHPG